MKKFLFLSMTIIAALFGASCSNDNSDSLGIPEKGKQTAIGFKSFVEKNTKALSTAPGDLKQDFWVYAYYDSIGDNSSVKLKPNFMDNQHVIYGASGFTYSPTKFWPETGDVNFYAYTPNTSKHITITKPALADSLGYPVFTYTVDSLITSQEDLLVAQAEDQDGINGNVNFNFDHALTKIAVCARTAGNYQAQGATVKITGITFSNIVNSKSFSFDRYTNISDVSSWWASLDPVTTASYSPRLGSSVTVPYYVTDTFLVVTPNDQSLLMIPQNFTGTSANLRITYQISYSDGSATQFFTKYIPLNGTIAWNPGSFVNYALTINLSMITFTASLNDWNIAFQDISIIPEDDNE